MSNIRGEGKELGMAWLKAENLCHVSILNSKN